MNRQFIFSVVVVFLFMSTLGYVVHGILLFDDYLAMPDIMRPAEQSEALMHWMILAHVLMAIGMTWIYRMGREDGKSWVAQGARFGFAVALVSNIPLFMIYYVAQQEPAIVPIKQIAFDGTAMVLAGMVTALMNRS